MRNRKYPEARVALCRCENHGVYGVRFERCQHEWKYTWAFPIKHYKSTTNEYNATKIVGNIIQGKDYPGCPYCNGTVFFVCDVCGKLSCYHGEHMFTCPWCGDYGPVVDYTGYGFNGGNDR